MMSDGSANPGDAKQDLSALVDGELEASAVQRVCSAWREDGNVRSSWHAYQLIGDVLRSEDLASQPTHDEAFLTALRARLAAEPVVLAPEPRKAVAAEVGAAQRQVTLRRRTWAAPFAVAAGFVAVAGVLVVTRVAVPGASPASALTALNAQPSAQQAQIVAASASGNEPALQTLTAGSDLKLIRDARLDRYLAAHKQFDTGAAVSLPGVMLRNAAAYAPER